MYQLCIVCAHRLIREALREIVWRSPATVIGEGRDLGEALESVESKSLPDLVIFNMDFGSDANFELEQILDARRRLPSVKVVVLTDAMTSENALRAVRAGIHALLSRDIPSDIFQKAIHFVMLGQILLPATMAKLIVEDALALGQEQARDAAFAACEPVTTPMRAVPAPAAVADAAAAPAVSVSARTGNLSERENEILQCLVKGFSNKIIARRLSLAEATVKVHIKSVLRKLQATNRTQAAVWALNNQPAQERLPDDTPPVAPPMGAGQSLGPVSA